MWSNAGDFFSFLFKFFFILPFFSPETSGAESLTEKSKKKQNLGQKAIHPKQKKNPT